MAAGRSPALAMKDGGKSRPARSTAAVPEAIEDLAPCALRCGVRWALPSVVVRTQKRSAPEPWERRCGSRKIVPKLNLFCNSLRNARALWILLVYLITDQYSYIYSE